MSSVCKAGELCKEGVLLVKVETVAKMLLRIPFPRINSVSIVRTTCVGLNWAEADELCVDGGNDTVSLYK
jgi:hypothetical protein